MIHSTGKAFLPYLNKNLTGQAKIAENIEKVNSLFLS